jgi:hypothetical protein
MKTSNETPKSGTYGQSLQDGKNKIKVRCQLLPSGIAEGFDRQCYLKALPWKTDTSLGLFHFVLGFKIVFYSSDQSGT